MSVKKFNEKHITIDVDESVHQYELVRPIYLQFTEKLTGLTQDILNSSKIKYQVVEARTKDVQSFREKISRANKQYSDPIRQLTDLSGLRIIVYYSEDVDSVCKLIEREFNIDRTASVDKGQLLQPSEFGYRSIHYIISLSSIRKNLLEWKAYSDFTAEIQVRTVLQHAWAAVSHALQYKREEDVPTPFRRRLSRLAGLFELSDEEFSSLRKERENFSDVVSAKISEGNILLELNSITVTEYLKESDYLKSIAKKAQRIGFEVNRASTDDIASLISLSQELGIKTVKSLDEDINSSNMWIDEYLESLYVGKSGVDWSVSKPFLVELILLAVHSNEINQGFLEKRGWHNRVAQNVINSIKKKGVS